MAIKDPPTQATLRFGVPDNKIPASERCLFAPPAYLTVEDTTVNLHDARTDDSIIKGAAGLDTQGFAYIQHKSALEDGDKWLADGQIESVYVPECEKLIRDLTGAKKTVANHVYFRRKATGAQNDPKVAFLKGGDLDKALSSLPGNKNMIFGREDAAASLEPARMVHVDYTNKGLRATARYARQEIADMAQEILKAEDAGLPAPRCAAFSVWRPISTVHRDPLIVCDSRTMDDDLMQPEEYRARSDINQSQEYMNELYMCLPPGDRTSKQKWCWMSKQTPDYPLIIKFSDTGSEKVAMAAHCAHGSPMLPGVENEPVRESVEVRVLAFW